MQLKKAAAGAEKVTFLPQAPKRTNEKGPAAAAEENNLKTSPPQSIEKYLKSPLGQEKIGGARPWGDLANIPPAVGAPRFERQKHRRLFEIASRPRKNRWERALGGFGQHPPQRWGRPDLKTTARTESASGFGPSFAFTHLSLRSSLT